MIDQANNPSADAEVDISSLFGALWRRKGWVFLWALVGLALATVFLVLVEPVYQSDARLLIERRETVFTRPSDERNAPAAPNFDALSVTSQVEVLRSRNLLQSVATKLNLGSKAEFDPLLSGGGSPVANVLALLGVEAGNIADTRDERILKSLNEKVTVYPVNDSRVVSVEVTSQSPVLAAEIANAISAEYILTQREDTRTSTAGASKFLEGEIADLRKRVSEAESKVEEFRSSADLITADDESTLTKQQLSETLTLLSEVNSQRAEAEAKADQIRRLINSGAALDSSSDVQGSPLIQRLREQQVALRAQIVDLQTSLLPSHPQVQAARSQLNDLEEEIGRQALLIARALEGDSEVAKVRQQELEQEVARLKTAASRANEQEVQLRALEREARAQRELLETYLTRFRESSARQNADLLPVNARIISKANVPIEVHFPKTVPTLAVAGFAGAFLASLFILAGELMSGRAMQAANTSAHGGRVEPDVDEDDHWQDDEDKTVTVPLVAPLSHKAKKRLDRHKEEELAEASDVFEEDVVEAVVDDFDEEQSVEVQTGAEAENPADASDQVKPAADPVLAQVDTGIVPDEPVQPQPAAFVQDNAPQAASATVSSIEDYARRQTEHHEPKTDLYTMDDALKAIDRYLLEQIVVIPVLQDIGCADLALELSRRLAARQKSTVFVDINTADEQESLDLTGFTDVVAGEVNINDAVFADPLSSVDLMAAGSYELEMQDWHDGSASEVLDTLAVNYDVTVMHEGAGASVSYIEELIHRSDMLIFAVSAPLSRRKVADILREKIGDVPPHAMFIYYDDEGDIAA